MSGWARGPGGIASQPDGSAAQLASFTVLGVGRRLDVEQLIGAAEIAQLAGANRNIVHLWRHRYPDFPKPVRVLSQGALWYLPEVTAWLRDTREARRKHTPHH